MANKSECLLQGVIQDSSKEALLEKLKAICYVLEAPFRYRERVYKSIGAGNKLLNIFSNFNKCQDNGVELRTRCDLMASHKSKWYDH
jgi:hypothetical protein